MKLIAFFILIIPVLASAKLLTPEEMAKCKSIAIVAGTYDPFTNGHEQMGIAIRKELPFDCVVYLPTKDTPHKISSPFQTRYEMLEAALKNQEGLFYPTPEDMELSPKELVRKMREVSQNKTVFAVLGSDLSDKNYMYYINKFRLDPDGYIITGRANEIKMATVPEVEEAVKIVPKEAAKEFIGQSLDTYSPLKSTGPISNTNISGVVKTESAGDVVVANAFERKPYHVIHPESTTSSTKVRNFFVENSEFYFSGSVKSSQLPNQLIREDVSRYILRNGLYLGTDGITTRTPFRMAKTAFTSTLNKVGLYHPLREVMVNKHKQDQLTEIEINGKKYPLKKHLGSGLTADAYVFNYDGQDMVVKIANQRPNSPFSIRQDVLIGRWLNEKTSIGVPEVHYMDPEGKFKVATKVGGESLGEYLKRTNGALDPAIEMQLRSAVDDMLNLSKVTNIKLDLSVDNLKIWNGKVYLIDAGPIPADVKHPMSFEEFSKTWGSHVKVSVRPHCTNALKVLLLDLKR